MFLNHVFGDPISYAKCVSGIILDLTNPPNSPVAPVAPTAPVAPVAPVVPSNPTRPVIS